MMQISKVLAGVALLAAGACTDAGRFGADGGGDAAGIPTQAAITPGSASDPTSVAYFQQAVGDRVLFSVDRHDLTAQAKAVLDGQAGWLTANADYTAIIEGHADEQGTREYNLGLGARRANEAREYLISKGIAASRLKVVSFGKERPIEICSAEQCYSRNRRAVTVLAGGLTS